MVGGVRVMDSPYVTEMDMIWDNTDLGSNPSDYSHVLALPLT